ncbi:GNAT family N-acetyltransferase [Dermacoccaceae bacterium W4C1]
MRTHFDDATLTGQGFTLRALTDHDIDDVAAACQDPLTQQWLPLPQPYTAQVARSFVLEMAPAKLTSGDGIGFAIEVQGRLHGVIDLKKTDWRNGSTEIGYWVAPWGRGQGLAGRASRVIADWALTDQGLERVVIHCATGNLASQRSAEAAGFQREGIARSAGFVHTGRVDLVVYGLIRADLG